MYHIKHDKRTLISARMIVDGLTECLADKKFPEIGISELCARAQVSRSTFYRLFDTTVDVLQFLVDSLVKEASEKIIAEEVSSGADYIRLYLDFIDKNFALVETVIRSDRMDILSRALNEHASVLLPARLLDNFPENERDYLKAFSSSAIVSLYRVNLQHGRTESTKELLEIFRKLLRILYEDSLL
ncbi:MAG: TetR/AcrR family transcriptional regulator [Bacteroidales bacterium]|nr:TetR/AcrR family transcriptional regulator [Bacteroidales bacterium]